MFGKKAAPPAPAISEPAFSEKAFLERFEALIAENRSEEALDFFLAEAGALAGSKLHRRIKLNHFRYAARILEAKTQGKHGFEKLTTKFAGIVRNLDGETIPEGGGFLDFGCGEHDPLALALAFYLNGFDRAIACDMRPPHIPIYSAQSMTEIVTHMRAHPDSYLLPGRDGTKFERRINSVDVQPFIEGDFERGVAALAGRVDYRLADLLTLDVGDESLSLAVSFAVLEHVEAPDAIYEWLFRKTRPGGLQFHFIDLVDHRAYLKDGCFHEWSFLTTEEGPPHLNRLRAHEHLEKIAAAGFEIVKQVSRDDPTPEGLRSRLIAPWRDMTDEEIATTKLRVVLRRPG
jgi:SAM-dependent methyltransferase